MPDEIKKGRDIGKKPLVNKFIWRACPDCGKYRWVDFTQVAFARRCKSCAVRYSNRNRLGSNHPNWKGGIRKYNTGYIGRYLTPDDFFYSMANGNHCVLEHRLIMAKHLGRNLQSWEIVHHKNGIKDDNRIENLQIVTDDRHQQITILEQRIKNLEKRITLLEGENILLREEVRVA